MKLRVSEWGNSHGVRITSAVLEHLNVQAGEELEVKLTSKGVEIVKNTTSLDYLAAINQNVLESLLEQTSPVSLVEDPYRKTDVAYIVVDINPCKPLIREAPTGTKNSYPTLADAKEAARQCIQSSIAEAQKSLSELRQVGVGNITYISL